MLDAAPTLQARLDAAREHAFNGGVPIRRKDGKLYQLLAECLSICEEVIAARQEPELREMVRVSVNVKLPHTWGTGLGRKVSNNGRGRRFAQPDADAFILVARYVLSGVDGRNSHYRYAVTMREAHKRQIPASGLVAWLGENGGVNALYGPATFKGEVQSKKTLHLNQTISFPREGEFTLALRHDGKGFFDVVTQ
jgi:hypothetical protein